MTTKLIDHSPALVQAIKDIFHRASPLTAAAAGRSVLACIRTKRGRQVH